MSDKISGWGRLWIVATMFIWGAGLIHMYAVSDYYEVRVPRPPVLMSRAEICEYYPDVDPRGGWADEVRETKENCLVDDRLLPAASNWHWAGFVGRWERFWAYWAAPFILGIFGLGILWVVRGFRTSA